MQRMPGSNCIIDRFHYEVILSLRRPIYEAIDLRFIRQIDYYLRGSRFTQRKILDSFDKVIITLSLLIYETADFGLIR